jgi:hypothetical protein
VFALLRGSATVSISIACAVLAIRAALLPVWKIPVPSIPDEFSYLLMGDTFAAGRVTNPPHPMWRHFETLFVLQQPTYASMYAPAQGLILAAGRVVAGHPWWGVWFSVGLMCALLCWMLQQWLPPAWAAAGAIWAALQVGLSTYWINSYWGGAAPAAGGALVLGAAARLRRAVTVGNSLLMAAGLALLAASRPYEGSVFGASLLIWVAWGLRNRTPSVRQFLLRGVLPGTLVLALSGGALAWYCWRVTGSPLELPQRLYMRQYASTKAFVWQKAPPEPHIRHVVLREELRSFRFDQQQFDSARGAVFYSLWKVQRIASFYLGPLMFVPLIMLPWLLKGRLRGPILAALATLTAVFLTIALQPHYAAPLTGFFYLVAVQALRHLWAARRRANQIGRYLVPAAPAVCLLTVLLTASPPGARPAHQARAALLKSLESDGARHLVIVTYGNVHDVGDEWVYNGPDLNRAPVVWARDMGVENEELVRWFPDRKAWVLAADTMPLRLEPHVTYGTTTQAKPGGR